MSVRLAAFRLPGIVLLISGFLLVPLAATPAAAAQPKPATRAFTADIEELADAEPQQQCDPAAKPGVEAVRDLLRTTYGRTTIGIARDCSVGAVSEHKEGRALDWMISATNNTQKAKADAFLAWLLATDRYGNTYAMARRLGIQYVIWNRRIWSAYRADEGWRRYSGPSPHTDHVHLSFGWDGAMAKTSFFTGKALHRTLCGRPAPQPRPAALPATGTDFVPLAAARILDTRSGLGMSTGKGCRLSQQQRLDLKVLGTGGVPASGVTAVVLSIAAHSSNAPTHLTAYPAGGQGPGVRVVSPSANRYGSGTAVVPVGSKGEISITTLAGNVNLTVDVAGYYRAPSAAGSLYHASTPATALVIQYKAPLAAGAKRVLKIGGRPGIPASGVTAAVFSLTVPASPSGRFVAVYARGAQPSRVAQVSASPGRPATVRVVTPTDPTGSVVIENRGRVPVNMQVDLHGWYARAAVKGGSRFFPVAPTTLLDTRSAGQKGTATASRTSALRVTGVGRVPAKVAAVALQVTAVSSAADTGVTLWPAGLARPTSRDLTLSRGTASSDLVLIRPGGDGRVSLYNSGPGASLVASVVGYFR
jgi:hypothetical protein